MVSIAFCRCRKTVWNLSVNVPRNHVLPFWDSTLVFYEHISFALHWSGKMWERDGHKTQYCGALYAPPPKKRCPGTNHFVFSFKVLIVTDAIPFLNSKSLHFNKKVTCQVVRDFGNRWRKWNEKVCFRLRFPHFPHPSTFATDTLFSLLSDVLFWLFRKPGSPYFSLDCWTCYRCVQRPHLFRNFSQSCNSDQSFWDVVNCNIPRTRIRRIGHSRDR